MSHIRSQIRDAVVEKLRASGAFASCFPATRFGRDIQQNEYPAAFVAVSDSGSVVGRNPPGSRPLQRAITCEVLIAVRANAEDADEAIDDLAVAVEVALNDPATIGFPGKVLDWTYGATSAPASQFEEHGFIAATVTHRGTVTTLEGRPEANLHN
jgi:hypothetical protein